MHGGGLGGGRDRDRSAGIARVEEQIEQDLMHLFGIEIGAQRFRDLRSNLRIGNRAGGFVDQIGNQERICGAGVTGFE